MDAADREIIKKLRAMGSASAAGWIIENYPVSVEGGGKGIQLVGHLSWKKKDQLRLSRYYLQNLPHAQGWAYEIFAKLMSIETFIAVLEENFPESKVGLFWYYIAPVLSERANTEKEKEAVNEFFKKRHS